jgi:hypothetical protein
LAHLPQRHTLLDLPVLVGVVGLEATPDPQLKSMDAVDFVMAGRPGQVIGKIGKKE